LLGQHTREILLEHGFRDNEIDELCAQGIVGDATRTLS
jgi:crotonobetainyl-CoA:carnitine CoA-transferase CaiB-like acyl-CoA transferase